MKEAAIEMKLKGERQLSPQTVMKAGRVSDRPEQYSHTIERV